MNWYLFETESARRQQEFWREAESGRRAQAARMNGAEGSRHGQRLLVWLGCRLEETGRRMQARY